MKKKGGAKSGSTPVLFILLAFLLAFAPADAHATSKDECADGKEDAAFLGNVSADGQARTAKFIDITNQFPIVSASNACIEGIISALNKLPALADPTKIVGLIVQQAIMSIINQACSATLNVINGGQKLISNSLTLCLPLPNLNLNINANINSTPCSGGVAFAPVNFTSTGAPPITSTPQLIPITHK